MNWQIIFNPFTKFSEKPLLFFGLTALVAGSYLAAFLGVTFDGVIDVHLYAEMTFLQSLKENLIAVILITLLLFGLGKIINGKTRFIDIVNTSLLYRIPFYLSAVLVSIPALKKIEEELVKNAGTMTGLNLEPMDLILVLVMTVFLILLLIYAIILLYNGFKTATNVKQVKHKIFFGLAILIAEIISKIILSLF